MPEENRHWQLRHVKCFRTARWVAGRRGRTVGPGRLGREVCREEERLNSGLGLQCLRADAMSPPAGRRGDRCPGGARASVAAVHLRSPAPIMDPRVTRSFVRRRDAQKPLVLVVDDGAEARDLYCAYLEFHGFGAEAAEDGPSGIAMAL